MSKPAPGPSFRAQFFGRISPKVAESLVERRGDFLTSRDEEAQVTTARGEQSR